jgi:hypothetical protein
MSLDRPNRLATVVVGSIVATVSTIPLAVLPPQARAIGWVVTATVIVACLLAWAFSPTAVTLERGGLHVRRRGWRPLTISFGDIARVERGPDLCRTVALRLFGVGGFFGTYGLLWMRDIGRVRGYLTRADGSLLIRRHGALPVLVTPDDPGALLAALHRHGIAAGDRGAPG